MPQATVAAIVTSSEMGERTVLLTRRGIEPFKGQWCLPGGHIDTNEAALEAAEREVREETGVAIEARFLGYFDERIPERGIHAVVLAFVGEGRGALHRQETEVVEIGWFALEDARALPLAFAHNEILDAYAEMMAATG